MNLKALLVQITVPQCPVTIIHTHLFVLKSSGCWQASKYTAYEGMDLLQHEFLIWLILLHNE